MQRFFKLPIKYLHVQEQADQGSIAYDSAYNCLSSPHNLTGLANKPNRTGTPKKRQKSIFHHSTIFFACLVNSSHPSNRGSVGTSSWNQILSVTVKSQRPCLPSAAHHTSAHFSWLNCPIRKHRKPCEGRDHFCYCWFLFS